MYRPSVWVSGVSAPLPLNRSAEMTSRSEARLCAPVYSAEENTARSSSRWREGGFTGGRWESAEA